MGIAYFKFKEANNSHFVAQYPSPHGTMRGYLGSFWSNKLWFVRIYPKKEALVKINANGLLPLQNPLPPTLPGDHCGFATIPSNRQAQHDLK